MKVNDKTLPFGTPIFSDSKSENWIEELLKFTSFDTQLIHYAIDSSLWFYDVCSQKRNAQLQFANLMLIWKP